MKNPRIASRHNLCGGYRRIVCLTAGRQAVLSAIVVPAAHATCGGRTPYKRGGHRTGVRHCNGREKRLLARAYRGAPIATHRVEGAGLSRPAGDVMIFGRGTW
ncbi:hypothetical protein KCP70_17615 [Salmonella enterica subsp. enterica]|nr:hypothetical protein KCP70_17615 [Salmonella enterica subsp. enterica]